MRSLCGGVVRPVAENHILGVPFSSTPEGADESSKAAREELSKIFIPHVQDKLVQLCGLKRLYHPFTWNFLTPKTEIWATDDWQTADTLLLLLTGIGLPIGFWGTDLCMEQGMERGSQLPHIRRAIEEGWGVLVLNPNQNWANALMDTSIEGHETPENHLVTVWKAFVSNAAARKVAMITHSYGGVCLVNLLETHPDVTHRLFGIAMNDCGGVRSEFSQTPQVSLISLPLSGCWRMPLRFRGYHSTYHSALRTG